MKRKQGNILILVLASAAAVSIATAGFFVWQNWQKTSGSIKNSPVFEAPKERPRFPDSSPASSSAFIEWKIYVDSRYGYSVKYPPSVTYKTSSFEGAIVGQQESETVFLIDGGTLTIAGNVGGMGLEGVELINAMIGENVVSKFYATPTDGVFSGFTSPQKDDLYFYFTLPNDTNKRKTVDDTINQILSTFKFLDQNAEGQSCGGFAGKMCPEGYWCQTSEAEKDLPPNTPDSGSGTCVKNTFTCPVNGWLNCMPILSEEGKRQCENVSWFKRNCPNFQGVAY